MNRRQIHWLTGPSYMGKLYDMPEIDERVMVEEVERRLADRYADIPPERITSAVQSAHARFEHSPIRDFVPLFVERRARAELARG